MSHQVSRTPLIIPADFNLCCGLKGFYSSSDSKFLLSPFRTVQSAQSTIGVIVTFMFHVSFSSLTRYKLSLVLSLRMNSPYLGLVDCLILKEVSIRNHHHHHVVPPARISLTLSRHSSLSFIALGRSSGQHHVSSHSC